MLHLSRRAGESIVIPTSDGTIRITIVKQKDRHGKVAVGVQAPSNVAIYREEIMEAIIKQKEQHGQ